MHKYTNHSNYGDGRLSIRPIDSGFIVEHKYLLGTNEVYCSDLKALSTFLNTFYREK